MLKPIFLLILQNYHHILIVRSTIYINIRYAYIDIYLYVSHLIHHLCRQFKVVEAYQEILRAIQLMVSAYNNILTLSMPTFIPQCSSIILLAKAFLGRLRSREWLEHFSTLINVNFGVIVLGLLFS